MAKKPPVRAKGHEVTRSPHATVPHPIAAHEAATPDRRVRRTHDALRAALYASIREHGWEAVHVQELCERANVGRSTFYAHFADKEDLLVSGFADLAAWLREHADAHRGAPLAFARPLLEHVREHWWIFRLVSARRSGNLVRDRLTDVVAECVLGDAALAPTHPQREAAARYVAGAFVELVRWWMEPRNGRASIDEVAALFERMTGAALREGPAAGARSPS